MKPSSKPSHRAHSSPDPAPDHLALWLEAEDRGDEACSERALLELLAHLPEAQPAPKSAKTFAQRVVERIEADARSKNRWSLSNAATLLAASVLVCWVGAIVYGALLGVDPTRASSLTVLVGDAARAVVSLPQFAVDLLVAGGDFFLDIRQATLWAYSPWSVVAASSCLLLAAGVLWSVSRLYPIRHSDGGYGSSPLGAA